MANHQTRKSTSVESILLLILFLFGMMGFLYAFNGSKKSKGENIVIVKETPISSSQNSSNAQ